MSTSALPTTLDAIRAALVLRSNLSAVKVFSGPVFDESELGAEHIQFDEGRLDEEALAMSGNRMETWDVDGYIETLRPWQTTTETTIKAARDRAFAIFAEIETHVNDTYTGTYPDVEVTAGTMTQGAAADGTRVCRLKFTLRIRNPKNP